MIRLPRTRRRRELEELEQWVHDWVLTGETRGGYEDEPEEHYAGWLDVRTFPAALREVH